MTTEQPKVASTQAVPRRKWLTVLAYIALAGLLLILGLVGYVSTLPDDFRVQRTANIDAPAGAVFPLIDNFHEWPQWSPWEKLDPGMQRTYEGPDAGKGAAYSWGGNNGTGAGKMTIIDSKHNELVGIKLEFTKPFAGLCPTTFKLEPSDSGTKVTWTMDGKYNFISKTMSVFLSMDKMIGSSFEEGLAKMNAVAQANAKQAKSAEQK